MVLGGNHKSEKSALNTAVLEKPINKEVEHVWEFPLTINSIRHIKNTGVIPLVVVEKFTINKKGERYTKICVTHKFSLPSPSGLSVNNRVLRDTLQPCFYGFCLLKKLHMIAAVRIK